MIRKLLVIAAAIAMPVSAIAAVGITSGVAGAKSVTPDPITCSLSGVVTFAAPGLSSNGSISTSKDSSTTTSIGATGTGCQTTPITSTITSKSTEKCKTPTSYPACASAPKNAYIYDSDASFESGGVADLVKALHKGVSVTDNGVPLTLVVTAAGTSQILPGEVCGPAGVGFAITGTVKKSAPVANYTLNVCLTSDSGPGTSGSFFDDIASSTGTIASATVGSPSSLSIT